MCLFDAIEKIGVVDVVGIYFFFQFFFFFVERSSLFHDTKKKSTNEVRPRPPRSARLRQLARQEIARASFALRCGRTECSASVSYRAIIPIPLHTHILLYIYI